MGMNSSTGAPLDMIFSHVASVCATLTTVSGWLEHMLRRVPTDYCIWNLIGWPICLGITPMLFQNDIHEYIE